MRKLIVFIIISALVLLTACNDMQEAIQEENNLSVKQNEEVKQKENNNTTDIVNEKENTAVKEENSNSAVNEVTIENEEEQEVTSNQKINLTSQEITDLVKTMNKVVMTNIVTKLTAEQQKELQELLNIEEWVHNEPEGRGASLDCIIRNDNGAEMMFLDGYIVSIMTDSEKHEKVYYTVSEEVVEQLKIFALKVRDEGIKNGNEILANWIKEFNNLIIGEPEQLYEIEEKYIYPISEEALNELFSIYKIEQWKVYKGVKDIYNDEDTPLTLHKYLYGYDMLLQIKQYGDVYIIKSRSYEGPTDQDYVFEISEEIYLNLIKFKENFVK